MRVDFVRVSLCMFVRARACMFVCARACVHVCARVCAHVCARACVHVCACMRASGRDDFVRVSLCLCGIMHVRAYVNVRMRVYVYIGAYPYAARQQ